MPTNLTLKNIRIANLSLQVSFKNIYIILILFAVLFAVLVFSIGIGTKYISPDKVFMAFLGEGKRLDIFVIHGLRMPRGIIAIFSGASLGIAGLLLQTVTKNPLASPSAFGVVEGAALGAVLFLAYATEGFVIAALPIYLLPIATTIGALLALILVLTLARIHHGNMLMMILYGIAIAAMGKALTTLLMIEGPFYRASEVSLWLTGDLAKVNIDEMWIQMAIFTVLFIPLILVSRFLDVMVLNDDNVKSIGVNVKLSQYGSVILAALFTACAVSFAGGIGFVGLIAPHLARMLLGQSIRSLIFGSLFIGALLVLVADMFGRTFMPLLFNDNLEIPTGVFTAIIGAPYFFYLIYQGGKLRK